MIPDETIEQVRDSTDLVGLIGESVALKRTGSDYRGPCPFHGGTNRNFAVIPRKGRYYCFVCHESGDVFSWFMKRLGMDYPTAVREAARRTGIVIPERADRAGPDPHEPLYSAMAVGHDWFSRQLLEHPDATIAREYLESRDIPLDTAALLGLGYAPVGNGFLKAMAELGVEEKVLVESGLAAQREDGSVSPRFRRRLLFPIHNLRGRLVGLGGRLLGPGEPKYLNSPETEIFHKGKQLYNLHQARGAIRKEESVLLVEGYFDVIRLSLAGVENVVAPLGTALTPDQAALLKRFAPAAIILYDSDPPGLRATFRAGDELLRQGLRVRVATLPPGEDPDTLVKTGGVEALDLVVGNAIDLLERKIQLLERKGWFEDIDHRRDALDRLFPTLRAAADPITRDQYLSLAAKYAEVSRDVLEKELAHTSRSAAFQPSEPRRVNPPSEGAGLSRSSQVKINPESQLLRAMLSSEEWVKRARDDVTPALFNSPRHRELFETLLQARDPLGQMPAALSEDAQTIWTRLKEKVLRLDEVDVGMVYDQAVQILRARPEYEKIARISDPGEKRRMRDQLRLLYPEADRWYSVQRGVRPTKHPRGA
jgi:DNA primase